ncbi:MAG: response regulator [Acidobacteria bacterium]|nr:response regulator [Acidobacteriota bacterium]
MPETSLLTTVNVKRTAAGARTLRSSASFLSAVLDQITQPFAVSDQHGRLILWNRALEVLCDYEPVDPARLTLANLIASEPELAPQGVPALANGDAYTCTAKLRTRNGELIPVELRFAALNSPDGEPMILVIVSNLSERQRLEAELRQSQKMEAIGKLAGGIAHDFNNVLTTILGLTESMISGRMTPNAESLREIHHAGAHAAELTNSLLAFSRRQILQMKTIRLETVMASIAKMVGRLIGEDIRLQVSAAHDLPAIRADQSQIEQVLLNLSLNARDAMPKGGELCIRATTAVIDDEWAKQHKGSRPGKYVTLSVQDTGVGMDEETLRRLFEPFFTRKAPGKGTGLGLSMVYGIVKQHDAFIDVTSTEGKGTEFAIYFPPAVGEVEEVRARDLTVSAKGSATVLIVEDEKSVRRLVVEVLSNLGYRTFAAANGEEAVRIFERWADQIDLVLLDAILPKKGAREVYDAVRARKPSMRFLFTSGYNEVFINTKFELDPSFDFLRKPFTTLELVSRIQKALA